MSVTTRNCDNCNNEYTGQGKKFCSIECKGIFSRNKKLNLTDEHREKMSKLASERFKDKTISQEHKNKVSKAHKELWQNIEYKEKQSNSRIGRIVTDETKKIISEKNKGIKKPGVSEYNKNRPSIAGWKHTEIAKLKIGEKNKGEKNGMYGKFPKYNKKYIYICKNNIEYTMRSSWEILFAKYLDKNNINWKYEKKTYK